MIRQQPNTQKQILNEQLIPWSLQKKINFEIMFDFDI
jgi:hypothetical protein